ncbi:MAG: hypothetical protein ACRD21_12995 [Vicinamibacteria bacterium]
MQLADRIRRLEAVPLSTVAESSVEVPYALLAKVQEALLHGETHYTVRLGLPELRRLLAGEVARRGGLSHESSIDDVVVTTGESEALFVTLLGMSLPPGEVLVASFLPRRHEALFRLMELEVRDSDEARRRAGDRVRLVYREASSRETTQAELLSFASEQDLPDILNLEHELGGGGNASFPPFAEERTVILGDLDAFTGMASFRVGFLMGPERWLRRIRVWKQALTICSPAPSQRAAWVALGGIEESAS